MNFEEWWKEYILNNAALGHERSKRKRYTELGWNACKEECAKVADEKPGSDEIDWKVSKENYAHDGPTTWMRRHIAKAIREL